jgi:hypothetical protein
MAGHRPGHVRLSSTPIAILVVQKKLDYPVSETGLSGFRGFKALDRPYPFTNFPLFSLTLKNIRKGDPKSPIGDFLVPLWNLRVLG